MAKKHLPDPVETVGPDEVVRWDPPAQVEAIPPTPATIAGVHQHRPGVYEVVLTGRCPKRIVETGLPAGPAAEAVARQKYMAYYELVMRPGLVPDVTLME